MSNETLNCMKWMLIIFGVIIAVIEITFHTIPFFSESVAMVLLGICLIGVLAYALFVLVSLGIGWGHSKLHIKAYTVVCFFWELVCALFWFAMFF